MRLLRKTFLFILVVILAAGGALLIIANRVPSRVTPAGILWETRYNGPANEFDRPSNVVIAPSGDVIVFGSGVVQKYDGVTGKLRWQNYARVQVLVVDARGDLYAAGSEDNGYKKGPIAPPFSGRNTDIAVFKYSGETGNLIWKQSYDGRHNDTDWAQGIALDSSGNPVIAGFSPNDTRYYCYLAKYDAADGNVIWEHCGEDEPAVELWHGSFGMKLDSHDDVVFVSSTKENEPGGFTGRYFIEKLSGQNGCSLWQQRFQSDPKSADFVDSLDLDREGNVIVAGYSTDSLSTKIVITKFGALDGKLLWSMSYKSMLDGGDRPSAIAVDSRGDIMVCVSSRNSGYKIPGYEGHTLKYSGVDGRLLWDQTRSVPANSTTVAETCLGRCVVVDCQGALVLFGNQWNGRNIDYQLTWLSSNDGRILREISYDGPAGDHDLISGVAFASDGRIVVTGNSSNCSEWLKPAKSFAHWVRTGRSLSHIERESNNVYDDDPYNYDFMTVTFPALPDIVTKH